MKEEEGVWREVKEEGERAQNEEKKMISQKAFKQFLELYHLGIEITITVKSKV